MDVAVVIERVERIAAARANTSAAMADLTSALVDVCSVRAVLDAAEADLSRRVAAGASFPEAALAETSRGSLNNASKTLERAATLDAAPKLADALDNADVTAGHIDALTRAAKGLEPDQAATLLERVDGLVDVAAIATVEAFGQRIRNETSRILADDGIDRLTRQRRETSLSTWVGPDDMWNLRGRFDPLTGVKLAARLDTAVDTLFAQVTPGTCPSDSIAKQQHLRALALAELIKGAEAPAGKARAGRPEFVAVIDISSPAGSSRTVADSPAVADSRTGGCASRCAGQFSDDGPRVTWPIPIEIPQAVLAELIGDDTASDVTAVVVANGAVLHSPGRLDLGRTTRLANRAQRRALRALYATCAIPGCATTYDRCKLHHIVWWRQGGATDLRNLLPVCSLHHHKIHDDGWGIELGTDRQLTLRLPDGTIRNTGPPTRSAA